MADGKIQTPFSEITSPGGLKCQEFGGRRGFEERQLRGAPTEVAENAIKEIKQDLSHGLTLRADTAKD